MSPVGPLTAAAPRRPSIFHRRAANAAAAAAAAAASSASAAGAAGQQPLIAVPSSEYEAASIHSMDAGQRSVASTPTVDSPAPEYGLPPPALASIGTPAGAAAAGIGGLAADAAGASMSGPEGQDLQAYSRGHADDAASQSSLATSAAALAAAVAAGDDAALAPVLLSQGTVCDWSVVLPIDALGLRYGTVKRSRLGRVGISIPYPGSGNGPGTALGASVGGVLPGSAAGAGPAAVSQGASTPSGQPAAVTSRNRPPPVRSIKFKHVRFNRVHARLTYESPALSIRNFGLDLDNRVYRNIDGGWRSVLNRCVQVHCLSPLLRCYVLRVRRASSQH